MSVLPAISKVYEKAVCNRLNVFLNQHDLIDDEQHGFRAGRSTVTAVVSFIEEVIDSLDKGFNSAGVFMDMSQAFDNVEHKKLIDKLDYLGIRGTTLNWFRSYLEERYQFVEISHLSKNNWIKKTRSKLEKITLGVPQGSILGPLLFICYIKNLPAVLKGPTSKLSIYADDINLRTTGKTLTDIETSA